MKLGEQKVTDAAGNVVLEMKQLSGRTLDQQCTDMATLIHVDKLRVDSHLRALARYAAIDDIVNAKAPPRLDCGFCFPARCQWQSACATLYRTTRVSIQRMNIFPVSSC